VCSATLRLYTEVYEVSHCMCTGLASIAKRNPQMLSRGGNCLTSC